MYEVGSPFYVNEYIQAQMTEAGYDYNTSTPKPQMTLRPAKSKKVFPVARWGKKNGQSGGREIFFCSSFIFHKLECRGENLKKEKKGKYEEKKINK